MEGVVEVADSAFERELAGLEGGGVLFAAEAEGALGNADLGAAALTGGEEVSESGWWRKGAVAP